jgi:transketolase
MESKELKNKNSWHIGTMSDLMKSAVAGRVLADLADEDDRIYVLTADIAYSNNTIEFARRHPDRFFNLGIAEQNMVSVAAGLATTGTIPYAGTFASFLALLCCEHIRTDLAYTNLPVRLLSSHAGISFGYYGTSHHATEDIGIMRSIANLTIISPADGYSLEQALRQTVDMEGPIYFRLGRGRDPVIYGPDDTWEFGKVSVLRKGGDATLFATGIMTAAAVEASEALAEQGINITVVDVHTLKPLDRENVLSLIGTTPVTFVAEEHNTYSGLASIIADLLVDEGLFGKRFERIGFPSDKYALIAAPYHLYRHYGLDAQGVVDTIKRVLAA